MNVINTDIMERILSTSADTIFRVFSELDKIQILLFMVTNHITAKAKRTWINVFHKLPFQLSFWVFLNDTSIIKYFANNSRDPHSSVPSKPTLGSVVDWVSYVHGNRPLTHSCVFFLHRTQWRTQGLRHMSVRLFHFTGLSTVISTA